MKVFQLIFTFLGITQAVLLLSGLDFLRIVSFAFGILSCVLLTMQAMNFFAGLLLLLMPEENAFWYVLNFIYILFSYIDISSVMFYKRCFSVVSLFQKEEVIIAIQIWNNFCVLQYLAL